jgi:hypothetical protein
MASTAEKATLVAKYREVGFAKKAALVAKYRDRRSFKNANHRA